MLIHIAPSFLTSPLSGPNCEIVDLKVPELGLNLLAGRDLVTRRPHPNKRYQVACRKVGRKAMNGILVEAPGRIDQFTATIRWAINGDRVVVHEIDYRVLDNDELAITEYALLWGRTHHSLGSWENRWPDHLAQYTPMELYTSYQLEAGGAPGLVKEECAGGVVVYRKQLVDLPTVEPERLQGDWATMNRVPQPDHAFRVSMGAQT